MCVLLYDEGDKSRASAITSERGDFDTVTSFQVSNGSSHVDLEEMAAFCDTTGCRKEFLYAHFGFPFESKDCPRNCNCGMLDKEEDAMALYTAELLASEHANREVAGGESSDEDAGNAVPKGQIEYYYQRVLTETKKLGLPKREALSRRVVHVSVVFICIYGILTECIDSFWISLGHSGATTSHRRRNGRTSWGWHPKS